MPELEEKAFPTRKVTDHVDCLKQLKAAGTSPKEMII